MYLIWAFDWSTALLIQQVHVFKFNQLNVQTLYHYKVT